MRPKLEITRRREETWLAAMDSGMTTAEIATASGVTPQYVRRLVKAARASRDQDRDQDPTASMSSPATTSTPEPSELPRLTLTDSETIGKTSDCLSYSLATDAVSLDGGSTWISPDDPSTPRMPVLVSDRNGRSLRKHHLQPRPFQRPPEPPGPTSHKRTPGLKGGRG